VSIEMCFPNLPNAGANYRQTVSNAVFGLLRISGRRRPRVGDGLPTIRRAPG
jgi:hypothetical protein